MKALKDFITKNKLLVSVTSAVTMCVFMVFSVIAVAIGGTSSSSETEIGTTRNVAEVEGNTSSTVQEYTGETEEYGSEGDEDETEEITTEPIDPDTLPYMIKVNRAANVLTVYAKDNSGDFTVPYKAITVSCGKNVGDTPLGTYQTIQHYNWRLMNDGTFAQHAYRIVGPILFHSVPYYSQAKNDLEWEEFNKLGSAASLGCVRMTVADSLWIKENCPIGTKVVIYDDAANPGPLGKPDTIKIPEDSPYRGWDPTDPDPANPWHQFSASISYPASQVVMVEEGSSIDDILLNFAATDTCGNDISHKIMISGDYDLNTDGTYDIIVSVTDAIGSYSHAAITLIVNPAEEDTSEEETSSDEEETSSDEEESSSDEEESSSDEEESSSQDETTSNQQETSSTDGSNSPRTVE